ncbi:MAG: hypothetical protein DRP46_11480 [Candidatus Zixiibacteriota bacterium]|nr:MAG: hypothetical protein DRP46_11480 [candidate division Zixibacteria bacterium]
MLFSGAGHACAYSFNPQGRAAWPAGGRTVLFIGVFLVSLSGAAIGDERDDLPEFTLETARDYALKAARSVLEDASNEAQPHFNLAMALAQLGRYEEAENEIRAGLKLNPERDDMYKALGEIRIRQSRFEEAAELLRKALDSDPDAEGVHRRIGMALAHSGDHEGAQKEYELELERRPNDALCQFLLGQTLLQLKEYEAAEKHLLEACRLDPQSVNAFYALTQVQTRLGKREEAKETLNKFRELKKLDKAQMAREILSRDDERALRELCRSIHHDAAVFYASEQRWQLAEKHLRQAIRIDPKAIQSRENLASFLFGSGRLREAAEIYEELAELKPDDADILLDLGTMYAQLGDLESAEVRMERALELDPDMPEAMNNLARMYLANGRRVERALELAQRLATDHPTAMNYDLLAWAYYANGRMEMALEASASALELEPDNPRFLNRYKKLQSAR